MQTFHLTINNISNHYRSSFRVISSSPASNMVVNFKKSYSKMQLGTTLVFKKKGVLLQYLRGFAVTHSVDDLWHFSLVLIKSRILFWSFFKINFNFYFFKSLGLNNAGLSEVMFSYYSMLNIPTHFTLHVIMFQDSGLWPFVLLVMGKLKGPVLSILLLDYSFKNKRNL